MAKPFIVIISVCPKCMEEKPSTYRYCDKCSSELAVRSIWVEVEDGLIKAVSLTK